MTIPPAKNSITASLISTRLSLIRNMFTAVMLVTVVLVSIHLVEAQQSMKVPRIGYLSNSDPAQESARSEAIRLALRELGYIEGQNIATEYRYAEGKPNRYPELAAELVRLKVDIIVVPGGDVPIGRPRM